MSSKTKILNQLRENMPDVEPILPDFNIIIEALSFEEQKRQFEKSLKVAGAKIFKPEGNEEMQSYLKTHFHGVVDLRHPGTWEKYSREIPNEELGKIETLIIKGQFGVVENGAIWLDESNFPNRLLPFISNILVIVLGKGNIVSNMHEAYKKINMGNTGFGVFISGPSKTADIEQSLVYGAHGAKELFVAFIDS